MKNLVFLVSLVASLNGFGQKNDNGFGHVEPPFWWVGMKNPTVQIMFYDKEAPLSDYSVTTDSKTSSVKLIEKTENPHYLFVTLEVRKDAKAGPVALTFSSGKKTRQFSYELKDKAGLKNRVRGFNSSDVIYLIMPDRFSNGDTANDSIAGMPEGVHRDKPFGRHGGDLKGVANHIDYLNDLGVTALWLNPVLENKQKRSSYHGYSITDFYQVDRRFGTNEDYVQLIDAVHAKGMKVIQDMVANHVGSEHWMMRDLPSPSWVHQFPTYTKSSFRTTTASDPYQSSVDVKQMTDGWFDTTMPDINQTNPFVANYLIQNSLWWIEYAGIDGIRMDTWPFNDKDFLARYAKTLTDEYPSFSLVGEVWMDNVTNTAYWAKKKEKSSNYNSWLPSVTDFPFCFSVPLALNEAGGQQTGLSRLYNVLSQDFSYPDANTNLIFLDNHDLSRFFLTVNRDIKKYKMGLTYLLTTRGIPEIYYGTEILMDGDIVSHPNVRRDFPGGWKADAINSFTKEGRTDQQNEAFDFLKRLLNWRKSTNVVATGKLTHYVPEDNIYVYFRYTATETIMVILNGNPTEKTIVTARFAENIKSAAKATDIITGAALNNITEIKIGAGESLILKLQNN